MSESTAVDSVVTVAHLHDVNHHFDDMRADDFVHLQMSFLRSSAQDDTRKSCFAQGRGRQYPC